uniref:DUF4276 family protein n=1 Tax=Candidatus Kentrum sp. MB TaxID=2138164 RepID=A0A451B912_9GAMM|nr:MAG: protein of unknown function (DUF4276) [Candidatus Kentron sp. MB]VFK74783.1 MAG: protein of unknown function (DUF4276) [Candidatus Kentron sp. MB]
MIRLSAIVEGKGEVKAFPIVLRRLAERSQCQVNLSAPIRVHRDQFLNDEKEFRRKLQLAAYKSGDHGWVLILLDADDDCPARLSAKILERVKAVIPHRQVSVVLANREFEAWFLAAARSLEGERDFSYGKEMDLEPETIRDAKGWLGKRMSQGYHPVTDQPAFAARFDLKMAHNRSRSFRKLCDEWERYTRHLLSPVEPKLR